MRFKNIQIKECENGYLVYCEDPIVNGFFCSTIELVQQKIKEILNKKPIEINY